MFEKNIAFIWIKAEFVSVLITAISIIACAFIITYTNAGEGCINIVSPVITAVSAFLSAVIVSSNMNKRGILWGMGAGVFYIIILLALLFLSGRNVFFGEKSIFYIFIAAFFGAIGGIFGINIKK